MPERLLTFPTFLLSLSAFIREVFPELQARGLVHDSTPAAALEERLASHSVGVYVGFDPTANSLHVGHLLGQISLRRLQLAGHRPFPLAGGATGMVGDPSGRSEERNLLDAETLSYNVSCISEQLSRLLDFSPGKYAATLVNNADWTAQVTALDFLRDVGKHITINQMLAKDSVKSRLTSENGLSFTEFSYMLLQANDFRHLCEHLDCEMQMGGSDQWGNITAGIDLIRKRLGRESFGLTWPLVTKSDGTKFGKNYNLPCTFAVENTPRFTSLINPLGVLITKPSPLGTSPTYCSTPPTCGSSCCNIASLRLYKAT